VGTAAGVEATYRLGKGQLLQIDQTEELTGSIVSSNKPTSIFGGHDCMFIPWVRRHCDFALQQLPAFEQWGSEYVGAGYRPRLGDEHEPMPYRIVAARDGTRLEYDPAAPPGAPLTMSAGQVVTFWSGVSDAFVVRTQDVEHPIYVAAYMSGGGNGPPDVPEEVGFEGNGDPEFVKVIPAGQYLNSYSVYADPTYQETSLVIVRAKTGSGFKDVWLECAGKVDGFRPIGTNGKYEYRRVDLMRGGGPGEAFGTSVCNAGLHRLRSDGPFTVTLWGWSQFASYAYPAGMAQRKLVQTPLNIR
jgi:IgGFc binding protein